jgi:hypothetical protein
MIEAADGKTKAPRGDLLATLRLAKEATSTVSAAATNGASVDALVEAVNALQAKAAAKNRQTVQVARK